jgi:hypothetical protein
MTDAELRAAYDRAVEASLPDAPPDVQMVYRHACGLAWQRLDAPAVARAVLAGALSQAKLDALVAPLVREALDAAPVQSSGKRLH